MMQYKYRKEDYETDMEWFKGLGVDETTANNYIEFMLEAVDRR